MSQIHRSMQFKLGSFARFEPVISSKEVYADVPAAGHAPKIESRVPALGPRIPSDPNE